MNMRNDETLLFYTYDLSDNLRSFVQKMPLHVNQVPEDQFIQAKDDELVNHIFELNTVDHIILHKDQQTMSQKESQMQSLSDWDYESTVTVPTTLVKIKIPFEGDPELWKCKTNPWTSVLPRGEIDTNQDKKSGILTITLQKHSGSPPEEFKTEYDREIKIIEDYLNWSKAQIEAHNASLPNHIRQAVLERRKRLENHAGLADLLGIPLTPKSGVPAISNISIKKRIITPLPSVPKTGLKPEPGIDDVLYENILNIIRHEGRTFETTPKTYRVHDEEELRDILLAHLNGHFQGAASAEAFRKFGKTDLKIEAENRSAFIGECKVWRGPAETLKALDQLTGYLTWRDCKAALVIFNKEAKKFSEILEKISSVLSSHTCFISINQTTEAGEWKLVLRSKEDEGRRILVRVFLFNLYVE
jgi:hypothetical protein